MPFTPLDERRRISHELKKIGFGGLEDPNLVMQMAFMIEGHDHFRSVLSAVKPLQRAMAYHAMRPHLGFVPKPLDVYEAEMKRLAEEKQLPTWNDETKMPEEFEVQDITIDKLATATLEQMEHEKAKGQLELVCTKCTKAGYFPAPKRSQAYDKAHREGWRWAERNGVQKIYCPDHVPGRVTMRLTCAECGKEGLQRAWDEQDAYAAARLGGWVIETDAKCPVCAVKKLVLQ